MPIRFRCAYCDQLMGISRRKAGTVVQCPRCAGQVIVPDPEPGKSGRRPANPSPTTADKSARDKKPTHSAGEIFERSDIDKLLQQEPIAYNPSHQSMPSGNGGAAAPIKTGTIEPPAEGLVLTPARMTLLAVGVVILMGIAFFTGFLIGGSQ